MREIKPFLEKLSAPSPVPGSGSVVAFAGALSSAILQMVCELSRVEKYSEQANKLCKQFMKLMEEDARAFKDVIEAREENKVLCLRKATLVPLEVMENGCKLLELVKSVAERAKSVCAPEVGVAAHLGKTCVEGAAFVIKVNLAEVKEKRFVSQTREKVEAYLKRCSMVAEEALGIVEMKLKG